ncbi:M28 family peptidase [Deinococcus sp. Marseille-Q6407]|uniref:M28 family peptidase n=1 Tax=Deinococcus sp. Marseille-Q6407 TaxID=2969223 RepID=UPI0021BFE60B|nr:M28 family peptidase [Deinococcus sp. Marseille-Q6407]
MQLAAAPQAGRIEQDIRTLVGFGTRHTMSDTASETQGIGAATRWMKGEFEKISQQCGGCLEIYEQRTLVPAGSERIDRDTYVTNVYAVLRGTDRPNDYVIMSGDIDSRVSDVMNSTLVSPGANDNASGLSGTIEAARVLSQYRFANSILFAGLSGEEQNLYGGTFLAKKAKEEGWNIIGVLNNDMIGNIEGVNGVIDNQSFRIFSEPYFQGADEQTDATAAALLWRRGGRSQPAAGPLHPPHRPDLSAAAEPHAGLPPGPFRTRRASHSFQRRWLSRRARDGNQRELQPSAPGHPHREWDPVR